MPRPADNYQTSGEVLQDFLKETQEELKVRQWGRHSLPAGGISGDWAVLLLERRIRF